MWLRSVAWPYMLAVYVIEWAVISGVHAGPHISGVCPENGRT